MSYPIDIVYTWVDDSDPIWKKKRQSYLPKSSVNHDVSGDCRFQNNDELLYSLRSVAKYCDWVNHIYIVTDNQKPDWLNEKHCKISIVDHKNIFDNEQDLPTYNSMAIEWNLVNIKGLSEHFIYLNDDMFIGKKLSEDYFFNSLGNAKIFSLNKIKNDHKLLDKSLLKNKKNNPYQHSIINSRQAVYDKVEYLARYFPTHGAYVFNKSKLTELKKIYSKLINETISSRFRTNDNVFIYSLYSFHQQSEGFETTTIKRLKKDPRLYRLIPFFNSNNYYLYAGLDIKRKRLTRYYQLIQLFSPPIFCINDCAGATPKRRKEMSSFLEKRYSDKSIFEL